MWNYGTGNKQYINDGLIIDFVFDQQQPKLGHDYFVQMPFAAAKQSVLGRAALPNLMVWDRNEQGLLNAFL